jgi:hypothetical protein
MHDDVSNNGHTAAAEADLPVLSGTEARPLPAPPAGALPVPVVAAATGGLVLGAATWLLLRVLRRPRGKAALRVGRGRKKGVLEIAGSRSFLVDVHVLKR